MYLCHVCCSGSLKCLTIVQTHRSSSLAQSLICARTRRRLKSSRRKSYLRSRILRVWPWLKRSELWSTLNAQPSHRKASRLCLTKPYVLSCAPSPSLITEKDAAFCSVYWSYTSHFWTLPWSLWLKAASLAVYWLLRAHTLFTGFLYMQRCNKPIWICWSWSPVIHVYLFSFVYKFSSIVI